MDAPLPATGRTQPVSLSRRQLLAAAAGLLPGGRPAGLASAARGRMVAWHAWAGCERTNAFIAWVAEQMMVRHGVRVRHVRLADPAAACARLAAGPDGGGADLVSVEDADLAGLRARGLLMPGLLARLPHAALLDADLSHLDPSVGDAAPWRRWRSVLVFNAARLPPPPARLRALPGWA
ncbi:MAG: hypothetical protein KGL55_07720, partial [Rhodospirillales bacterium]|nr:hypothetical protein [Rhodospirillales bacterium]